MSWDAPNVWEKIGEIAYGGDYNPEQWSEDVWLEDVSLMKKAGVNLVSLGIFSWASLQYGPDDWHFDWFDRVMDLLSQSRISVLLATATASPPPWLTKLHPEILPETFDGRKLYPGGRQHYCPSSLHYRRAAFQLVERLARRYAQHPALVGWHVGNEYGCHVSRCYCDQSAKDFRQWLKRRYKSVDELNRAWSTAFWSQRYQDWDEVLPPRLAPTFANPAQQLDFHRFSSDALLECFEGEAQILRKLTPSIPITTNFMGLFKPLDYFEWAQHEDFVSHDSYPDPSDPQNAAMSAALAFDFMRSAGKGKPWLLMEQAPSAVNWRERNHPKRSGLYRLWSYQAIAHGANGVMSFQWRASRGGAEKFHSAMVPHAGEVSRIYKEVLQLGNELSTLSSVISTTSHSDVAMVMSWPNWWALELESHPSHDVNMADLTLRYYRSLWRATVPVDFVQPNADLSSYKVVVVPNLYLVDDSEAENLRKFTEQGGHLVVSFFSGIVDSNDVIHPGGYPGPLAELLGISIDELWPLEKREQVSIEFSKELSYKADLWIESIVPRGAEVVAQLASGDLIGNPAVTRHNIGSGVAWYVGTRLEETGLKELMARVLDKAGVEGILKNSSGTVEACIRRDGHRELLFVLNHGSVPVTISLSSDKQLGMEIISGKDWSEGETLSPLDVCIFELR